MRVYLLSDYDEHGSENMVATVDPAKLEPLLVKHWNLPKSIDGDVAALRAALDENKTGKWTLPGGWGGVQLHVVDLA
jgi:hypothetical protein